MATPEESNIPKSSLMNYLTIGLLLINIVGLMVVAVLQWQFFKKVAEKDSLVDLVQIAEKEEKVDSLKGKDRSGLFFPLETFTVNLAQGAGPRRFIRLNLVLKLRADSKEEEFIVRTPQIRDAIINILNTKRPEDLLKKDGKEYFKEEITSAINNFVVDGKVIDVYYVNFQIN